MFTICYTYHEKRVVTRLAVDNLTPYAAVTYALLQAGVVRENDQPQWPIDYVGITEAARSHGVTGITFHRCLGAKGANR